MTASGTLLGTWRAKRGEKDATAQAIAALSAAFLTCARETRVIVVMDISRSITLLVRHIQKIVAPVERWCTTFF